jgi:Serine aminopeptidase, S33
MKIKLISLISISLCLFSNCGTLETTKENLDIITTKEGVILENSVEELKEDRIKDALYAIEAIKVHYPTIDVNGDSTIASGVIILPKTTDSAFPLLSYQHGTTFLKSDVASNLKGEIHTGKYFASLGYVTCMADYLGLGDSHGMHPYAHSDSEASACLDLIKYTKQYCKEHNIKLNDQLFLAGYSQGGHATIATLREIETKHSKEFNIVACASGSGPYDMEGSQLDFVLESENFPSPQYLPYIAFSYQLAYGNLFTHLSEIIQSPYDTILEKMMDGHHSGTEIGERIPHDAKKIFSPQLLKVIKTDSTNTFYNALKKNNLTYWKPTTPLRLFYCSGDKDVGSNNTRMAYSRYKAAGSPDVSIFDGGEDFGHGQCYKPFLENTVEWFDGLKKGGQ